MIVKSGSIVRVTYNPEYSDLESHTGIATEDETVGWIRITFLTPAYWASYPEQYRKDVGSYAVWYMPHCLRFFSLEILEEGEGKDLELWDSEDIGGMRW